MYCPFCGSKNYHTLNSPPQTNSNNYDKVKCSVCRNETFFIDAKPLILGDGNPSRELISIPDNLYAAYRDLGFKKENIDKSFTTFRKTTRNEIIRNWMRLKGENLCEEGRVGIKFVLKLDVDITPECYGCVENESGNLIVRIIYGGNDVNCDEI